MWQMFLQLLKAIPTLVLPHSCTLPSLYIQTLPILPPELTSKLTHWQIDRSKATESDQVKQE